MNADNATFIERLPELTVKGDRHRTKTHRHWWAPCDACGEGMWIETSRLAGGLSCRMTPSCQGRHRKPTLNPEEQK